MAHSTGVFSDLGIVLGLYGVLRGLYHVYSCTTHAHFSRNWKTAGRRKLSNLFGVAKIFWREYTCCSKLTIASLKTPSVNSVPTKGQLNVWQNCIIWFIVGHFRQSVFHFLWTNNFCYLRIKALVSVLYGDLLHARIWKIKCPFKFPSALNLHKARWQVLQFIYKMRQHSYDQRPHTHPCIYSAFQTRRNTAREKFMGISRLYSL